VCVWGGGGCCWWLGRRRPKCALAGRLQVSPPYGNSRPPAENPKARSLLSLLSKASTAVFRRRGAPPCRAGRRWGGGAPAAAPPHNARHTNRRCRPPARTLPPAPSPHGHARRTPSPCLTLSIVQARRVRAGWCYEQGGAATTTGDCSHDQPSVPAQCQRTVQCTRGPNLVGHQRAASTELPAQIPIVPPWRPAQPPCRTATMIATQ